MIQVIKDFIENFLSTSFETLKRKVKDFVAYTIGNSPVSLGGVLIDVLVTVLATYLFRILPPSLYLQYALIAILFVAMAVIMLCFRYYPKRTADIGRDSYYAHWEVYEQLYEWQQKRQKAYWADCMFLLFHFVFCFALCIVFCKEVIIDMVVNCPLIIALFFSIYFALFSVVMYKTFKYKVDFYSVDHIQLLWDKLKVLERELEKAGLGRLEEALDDSGKAMLSDIVLKFGLGYEPEDYKKYKNTEIRDIISTETALIKQIEEKLKQAEQTNDVTT